MLLVFTKASSADPMECHRGFIRIYHECEGRIEESIPRITVWHNEACPVMTNVDPEGHIFLSYRHTNNRLFFLHTTVVVFLLFQNKLNTLRCNCT